MSEVAASERQKLNELREKVQSDIDKSDTIGAVVTLFELDGTHSDEQYRSLASQLQRDNKGHEVLYGPLSRAFVITSIKRYRRELIATLADIKRALLAR